MFKIKHLLKSLLKYKVSSGLTLLSLVISFSGIIVLTLYVSFEKSYDAFHENAENIYRLEGRDYGCSVPAVAENLIKEATPEIEKITAIWQSDGKITPATTDENSIDYYASVVYASESFFELFSFPLIDGEPSLALVEPNSVVISETFANKLFGSYKAVGESVLIDKEMFTVTAVMKDFPKNSSFQADCISSMATLRKFDRNGVNELSEWSYSIFMLLHPDVTAQDVGQKISAIPEIAEPLAAMASRHPDMDYLYLLSIEKMHFVNDGGFSYSNPVILNILFLLAIILAVMAAVNFINFSTSQAPYRAKSLSVMQILGGKRSTAVAQIISEAIIISLVAIIISFLLYYISFRSIESFLDISGLHISGRYMFILWFILSAVLFGFVAGLYPARYITSSPIAQTVKGNLHFTGKGNRFRSTLVTIQFIFTIALICSAFTIEKQLTFWRNFDIGIDKEHVVYFSTTSALRDHYQALADELLSNEYISDYTYTQFIPGQVGMGWGREVDGQFIQLKCWPVDDRFIDFFDIEVQSGRKFRQDSEGDLDSFILNEKAVELFGWDNPLEKKMSGFGFNGDIIGVAQNFNFSSLKENIEPMQLWRTNDRKNRLLLRITPGNYTETLAYIKATARKFDPENPVEVKFLDDTLNTLYNKEEKMARLIEFVALWCILLAITGLLGLIIFISRNRIKEVGIRKVNGATIAEIISMFNKDFVILVGVAFVIATPLSWYAMHKWLESFAYKTALSWWIFALAGLIVLVITLITVSIQSWRAATRNPVESLRNE